MVGQWLTRGHQLGNVEYLKVTTAIIKNLGLVKGLAPLAAHKNISLFERQDIDYIMLTIIIGGGGSYCTCLVSSRKSPHPARIKWVLLNCTYCDKDTLKDRTLHTYIIHFLAKALGYDQKNREVSR